MSDSNHWPQYASPYEAIVTETSTWGQRLDIAQTRYDELTGELPSAAGRLAIGIVDGSELAENFFMLNVYGEQENIEPGSFGALLQVNFKGDKAPSHTLRLVDTIHNQAEQSGVPVAVSLVGYKKRRIDEMKSDTWDIAVVHQIRHKILHSIVGVNNDGDMSAASPHYLNDMTRNRYVGEPATVWGSTVLFDKPGGEHLPLNRIIEYLIRGRDELGRLKHAPLMYGASMGLTLDTYAIAGSWTGHYEEGNLYGINEPSRMVLNAWERWVGKTSSMQDILPAYVQCANRADGWVRVSPRRELYALATGSRSLEGMGRLITTENNNPYRALTADDVTVLAQTPTNVHGFKFRSQLDELDQYWISSTHPNQRPEMLEMLRSARKDLGLPLASFDSQPQWYHVRLALSRRWRRQQP